MSSAETTHPIEWRDDGFGGETAFVNEKPVARIYPEWGAWSAAVYAKPNETTLYRVDLSLAAARSFVERSVMEAGHGE